MNGTPTGNATDSDLVAVNADQVALSSITYGGTSGTTATATSSSSLDLSTGTQFQVTVTGASPSQYNGTFTATVTGSTTFTYTMSSSPGSNASGTNLIAGLDLPTLDGAISRVSGLQDHTDGTVLESYNYLGSNTIVQQNRPQPGVDLTYVQQGDSLASGDGGDRYTGLDRFGRVIDQFYTNTNTPSSPTDRFHYGYDANGNVLFSNNLVSSSNSELYSYDNLNRLTSFERGTLNSAHNGIVGTPSVNESWNLDALGNWTGGTQNRTFNAQNQITGITRTTGTPSYDSNGLIIDEMRNADTAARIRGLVDSLGPRSTQIQIMLDDILGEGLYHDLNGARERLLAADQNHDAEARTQERELINDIELQLHHRHLPIPPGRDN